MKYINFLGIAFIIIVLSINLYVSQNSHIIIPPTPPSIKNSTCDEKYWVQYSHYILQKLPYMNSINALDALSSEYNQSPYYNHCVSANPSLMEIDIEIFNAISIKKNAYKNELSTVEFNQYMRESLSCAARALYLLMKYER